MIQNIASFPALLRLPIVLSLLVVLAPMGAWAQEAEVCAVVLQHSALLPPPSEIAAMICEFRQSTAAVPEALSHFERPDDLFRAVVSSAFTNDVELIEPLIEQARGEWLSAKCKSSYSLASELTGALSAGRKIQVWSRAQLPRIKVMLESRMRLAQNKGRLEVPISAVEAEILDGLDQLDGINSGIEGNECSLSIERLSRLLGNFEADVAAVDDTMAVLRKVRDGLSRYYEWRSGRSLKKDARHNLHLQFDEHLAETINIWRKAMVHNEHGD